MHFKPAFHARPVRRFVEPRPSAPTKDCGILNIGCLDSPIEDIADVVHSGLNLVSLGAGAAALFISTRSLPALGAGPEGAPLTVAGEAIAGTLGAISLVTGGIATAGDCAAARYNDCAVGAIGAGLGIGGLKAAKAADAARLGDDFVTGIKWVGDFTGEALGAAWTGIGWIFGGG